MAKEAKKSITWSHEENEKAMSREITRENIEEHIIEWQKTKDERLKQDILIYAEGYIVRYIQSRPSFAVPLRDGDIFQDAVQNGLEQVLSKLDQYDAEKGKFTTYFTRPIEAGIKKALLANNDIPYGEKMFFDFRKMEAAERALKERGEEVTKENVMKELGMSESRYDDLKTFLPRVKTESLSKPMGENGEERQIAGKEKNTIDAVLQEESVQRIVEILTELVKSGELIYEEAEFFRWVYLEGEDKTNKEIREAYNITGRTITTRLKAITDILKQSEYGPELYRLLGGSKSFYDAVNEDDDGAVGPETMAMAKYVKEYGVYVTPGGAVIIEKEETKKFFELPVTKSNGYLVVRGLEKAESGKKSCYLHKLIAMAFCGDPGRGTRVRLRDRNRSNVHPSNISWEYMDKKKKENGEKNED